VVGTKLPRETSMRRNQRIKRLLYALPAAAIITFAALQISCEDINTSNQRKINLYIYEGKYEECSNYLDGLIKANPDNSYYYSEKGYVLIKNDKPNEAIKYLKKADVLKPKDDVVLNNLSWAYYNINNYKEALSYSISSLKISPKDPITLANKGNALRGLNRLKEALLEYDNSLKYDSKYTPSLYGKALTEYDLHDYKAAIKTFIRYNEVNPKNANSYLYLGEAYYNSGEDENAAKFIDTAIKLGTKDTDAYYYKGFCYNNEKKYDLAIKMFNEVIKMTPKDSDAYLQIGEALYYLNKYKDSLIYLDKSIKLDPNYSYTYAFMAKNYLKLGDYNLALKYCDKALGISPESTYALNIESKIYAALGKSSKAIEIIDKAIKLAPDNSDLYAGKAYILNYTGWYSECINLIEALFEQEKFNNDIDLRWYLADSYSDLDKHNIAIKLYEKLSMDFSSNADIICDLGWEYYYTKDYVNAEKFGNQALSINPKNERAASLIKNIKYSKLGDNIKIADFVKSNYLYLKKSKGFESASKILKSKKNATTLDIYAFLRAIVYKADKFTYFINGKNYDAFVKNENTSHIVTSNLKSEVKLIKIPSFTEAIYEEVKKYLHSLKATEKETLVIDLRDNPGGLIGSANELLDLLLPKCTSSYLVYGDKYKYSYTSDSKLLKFKKIIVMVNENSASSSELMSLSLKKHLNNVTIIGHKTFGKGVGQETYENINKRYVIMLTSFKWYVENTSIMLTKVIPDVTIRGSKDKNYFDYIDKVTGS
jgi:tetratricopeptide (TPR) repeat protein